MKVFKSKKKKNLISIYITLIFIETIFFINYLGNNLTTKLINITNNDVYLYNDNLIEEYLDIKKLQSTDIDNLIELIRKDNNDIIGLNYKINNAYKLIQDISSNLKNKKNEYLILKYPVGLSTNNILLSNLGYKVPVKIELISSMLTSLKTKVTNYGINNSLVEIYLSISITSNVIYFSLDKSLNNTYEILLGSSLVIGNIPTYLNGEILKNTTSIN